MPLFEQPSPEVLDLLDELVEVGVLTRRAADVVTRRMRDKWWAAVDEGIAREVARRNEESKKRRWWMLWSGSW